MSRRIVLVELVAVASLASSLLFVTPVEAHRDGLDHVNPVVAKLAPGASDNDTLYPNEADLQAGWEFLVVAAVQNASVEISLRSPTNVTVASWTVAPGPTQHFMVSLPERGNYTIVLHNPNTVPVTYAYYYDQSCNCAAKPIPVEIPDGMVVFNVDPAAGKVLDAVFPEPAAMSFKVTAAIRTGAGGVWPRDFTVLAESDRPDAHVDPKAPAARIHEITLTTRNASRIYFMVESTNVDRAKLASVDDITVIPALTVSDPPAAKSTPFPGFAFAITTLALAAFARSTSSRSPALPARSTSSRFARTGRTLLRRR